MAREGRIEGRVNGDIYELVQNGAVCMSIPLADVDAKFRAAIKRNSWEEVPEE